MSVGVVTLCAGECVLEWWHCGGECVGVVTLQW